MAVGRKGADDPDRGFGGRIGLVDDAERRFAARHQQERGADILRRGDTAGDLGPHAERAQRRLRVAPGRHGARIGHREMPVAEQRGERKTGGDRHPRRAVRRRDQHQAVAEQVDAGFRIDQLALLQIVHPILVSRDEQLGRRAILDLLGQGRARRIGDRRRAYRSPVRHWAAIASSAVLRLAAAKTRTGRGWARTLVANDAAKQTARLRRRALRSQGNRPSLPMGGTRYDRSVLSYRRKPVSMAGVDPGLRRDDTEKSDALHLHPIAARTVAPSWRYAALALIVALSGRRGTP